MKKVSIIVPCYGTEEFIEQCIQSLFNQSYKNIEIVAVNDCSPGNMSELLHKLAEKDSRLKIVENEKNKGLFHTRIVGSKVATGDYISFIDSDDYVDADYCRLLVNKAEKDKCDVVLGNYVRKNEEGEYIAGLSFNTNDEIYDGKEFYDMYFDQTGRKIRNHMLCSKLISSNVWKSVLKVASTLKERVVMTEDVAFSTITLFYAKKVGYCDNAIYYYINNDAQSTSVKNISIEKVNKNIKDILTVFDFIKNFLISQNVYTKYKEKLELWRGFYLSMHINVYKRLKKKNKNIQKLDFDYEKDEGVQSFFKIKEKDKSWDNYHGLITKFDPGLLKIKEKIMDERIKVVSFDLFDTLVTRPFMTPSDMFLLLNQTFIKEFKPIEAVDFSRIRKNCERDLREINYKKGIQEVTLDEIYDLIAKKYNLDNKKLKIIKDLEEKMELHFCRKRNSGYELYTLARDLNKKVILTSDIYLSLDLIKKILTKNGYEFDKIYLSSELKKTKASGTMFEYVIDQEKTKDILHIGDNYISDYQKPMEYDISSAQLFKAIDVFMGYTPKDVRNCGMLYKKFVAFNYDHIPYEENYGVRCSLALIANQYFDNPFRSFNEYSDFNGDPYFIGHYALGMQTIALCNWLLTDATENKIDSISFMARDGYIPYKASEILKNAIEKYNNIELNYIYVSRKALMPLLLKDKCGISMIETYLNYNMLTPRDVIKQLESVVDFDSKIEKQIEKKIELDKVFESENDFNDKLSIIYDNCFSEEKYNNYYDLCKKYFEENFCGNAATFDIGYSGKPEAIISSIIEKPITTYFIHANNSTAFNNMNNCSSKLKTFYDYKPTLTGTTRELFISSTDSTCIGYRYKNNKIEPIFSKSEKYNYFNIDMIHKIQQGALDFVTQFCDYFSEYFDQIDINKYYMSIPLEYYYHYVQMEDRLPTKNLLFEDNVNHYVEINKFIFNRYEAYTKEYNLGSVPKVYVEDLINYHLPRNRINRAIYYLAKDPTLFKEKLNKWLKEKKNSLKS